MILRRERVAVEDVQLFRRRALRDLLSFLFFAAVGFQDEVHLGPQVDEFNDRTPVIFVLHHLAEDLFVTNAEGRVRLGIVAGVVIVEV